MAIGKSYGFGSLTSLWRMITAAEGWHNLGFPKVFNDATGDSRLESAAEANKFSHLQLLKIGGGESVGGNLGACS